MPQFSLVIPTLNRADTLVHALATARAQSHDDVEILVHNNGNDPATREAVEASGDPRVRHLHTDEVVPMAENWERALAQARGEWITFIGDDDGLLPDACAIAAQAVEFDDTEILSWEPLLYLWPDFFDERRRNTLQATIDFDFVVRPELSRRLLEQFYRFEMHYSKLPMLYNSFVKRSLANRVLERQGRYFLGALPDVCSGIVNAAFTERFTKSTRPLSVAGISRHNIGHSFFYARANFARDFPLLADGADTAASNLEWTIGAEMLVVQERLQPESRPEFSRRGWLRSLAAAINNSPSRYDETRSLLETLAGRFEIDLGEIPIPDRFEAIPLPPRGATPLGDRRVLFVIDGGAAGLRSVDDAARLGMQLVPSADAITFARLDVPGDGIPNVSDDGLRFSRGESGAYALVSGWGDPEPWGSWSIDRTSTLRLGIPNGRRKVALELRYRTIPLPDGQPLIVECALGERTLHTWHFFDFNSQGEVVIKVPADVHSGTVDLTFVNLNAQSPLEMGRGPDSRRLGIGIEEVRLLT